MRPLQVVCTEERGDFVEVIFNDAGALKGRVELRMSTLDGDPQSIVINRIKTIRLAEWLKDAARLMDEAPDDGPEVI